MKSIFLRITAALLLLALLPACASALTGQSISVFETYYREDINYINNAVGRHLLPKDLAVLDLQDNGRTQYYYYDDALHITVTTDREGIIETCEIRLLYPEGAAPGNSLELDYYTASYHSLAYIMAMHMSTEVSGRFLLVEEIRSALEKNHGAYERSLGSYAISCVSVNGEGAVFTFTNNGLTPSQAVETTEETDGEAADPQQEPPAVIEEDEGANLG